TSFALLVRFGFPRIHQVLAVAGVSWEFARRPDHHTTLVHSRQTATGTALSAPPLFSPPGSPKETIKTHTRALLVESERNYTALVDLRTKSKAEQEEAKANEMIRRKAGRDIKQAREDLKRKGEP
ncbi:unnamed protein product, partial [Tilletia controversa]